MIRKFAALAAAAAVVALLVLTVLHRDRYRSLVFDAGTELPVSEPCPAEVPAAAAGADSVSRTAAVDSLCGAVR